MKLCIFGVLAWTTCSTIQTTCSMAIGVSPPMMLTATLEVFLARLSNAPRTIITIGAKTLGQEMRTNAPGRSSRLIASREGLTMDRASSTGNADKCPGKKLKIDCEQGRTHHGQ